MSPSITAIVIFTLCHSLVVVSNIPNMNVLLPLVNLVSIVTRVTQNLIMLMLYIEFKIR